jgi:hypothetical protein
MLAGLNFELNDRGLVDPALTRWIEDGLTRLTAELTSRDEQAAQVRP